MVTDTLNSRIYQFTMVRHRAAEPRTAASSQAEVRPLVTALLSRSLEVVVEADTRLWITVILWKVSLGIVLVSDRRATMLCRRLLGWSMVVGEVEGVAEVEGEVVGVEILFLEVEEGVVLLRLMVLWSETCIGRDSRVQWAEMSYSDNLMDY